MVSELTRFVTVGNVMVECDGQEYHGFLYPIVCRSSIWKGLWTACQHCLGQVIGLALQQIVELSDTMICRLIAAGVGCMLLADIVEAKLNGIVAKIYV